jgi:hypothetical protein
VGLKCVTRVSDALWAQRAKARAPCPRVLHSVRVGTARRAGRARAHSASKTRVKRADGPPYAAFDAVELVPPPPLGCAIVWGDGAREG